MPESDKVLELVNNLQPADLPVGVYVVTKDGRFIECNRQVREILGLPLTGPVNDTITRFYCDPQQREPLHAEVWASEAQGKWVQKTLHLKVNGEEKYVRDYTRSLRNEAGAVIGYVCCMTDVTEAVRYNRLFELLPIGVYQLDEQDRVAHANMAFADILGYDAPELLIGQDVKNFYADPAQLDIFRKEIDEHSSVLKYVVALRRQNGETIYVWISGQKIIGASGRYAGLDSTMIDVTREERYSRIMKDVPVGLFDVRERAGRDVIVNCNEQFATIFGYHSPAELIDSDARALHATPQDYERFMAALKDRAQANMPLNGYHLRVRTREGTPFIIEINSRALRDQRGELIGRIGAIRDITKEAELRDKVRELTFDFGNVLHTYNSTLLMFNLSLESVLRAFAPDPFPAGKELPPEEAAAAIVAPAKRLAHSLEQLLALLENEERRRAVAPDVLRTLTAAQSRLNEYDAGNVSVVFQPMFVGDIAEDTLRACEMLHGAKLPRELVRQVITDVRDLARIVHLITLHQAQDAIVEMEYQVKTVREYVTTDTRPVEPRVPYQVSTLITQARLNLEGYARSRGVRFALKLDKNDPRVNVAQREVVRALANLLHNAIKYSWTREQGRTPWVTIRTAVAGEQVRIEIENWGVPIPKDEIKQDLIFHIGFRGRLSSDRGRIGTGVGMTDARNVARAHGGDVTVTSQPAIFGKRDDDYKQPFITVVTMTLPLRAE